MKNSLQGINYSVFHELWAFLINKNQSFAILIRVRSQGGPGGSWGAPDPTFASLFYPNNLQQVAKML